MTPSILIEVELNLLDYQESLKTVTDYLRFWEKLSVALQGVKLVEGKTHFLESPDKGRIGLQIISVPHGFSVVNKDSRFAVYSVLEKPALRYKCGICQMYGPFRCAGMNCEKRLCDKHAIILDGNMRAYCPDHVPKCKGSGANATFWCDGINCHGRVAWSDTYRIYHPNDPDHWYCPDCFALEFPACNEYGCQDTGTTRCEYVDEITGKSCERSLCNRHVRRWQIYGPHKLGAALCSRHANIKQYRVQEILYQMVAITTRQLQERQTRRRRVQQDFIALPSLMSIRHIFINTQNQVMNPVEIDRHLDDLEQKLRAMRGQFAQSMARLLDQSKSKRNRELESFDADQSQGLNIFNRLKEKLRLQGEDVVVANLNFSDYRPRTKLLFVYLAQQYRGRLIGKQGATIKRLEQELDVRIQFEDKEPTVQ